MRRIVCIGNRLVDEDAAGPRVHDLLRARGLPEGVEVIDGGLAGLGLLCCADGAERLVFVDSTRGLGEAGQVQELDAGDLASGAEGAHGHGAGLSYLLRALKVVCDGPPPEIRVVGVEGAADEGATERAAALALRLALAPGGR